MPDEVRYVAVRPLDVPCPNCQARVGEKCTVPTNTARVNVSWFHLAREGAAERKATRIDDTYLEFGESEANPVECGSLAPHPRHEFYSHQHGTDVVCPGRGAS